MDTRERLLKEGEKEVSRIGTAAISLREVARSLGLSNMAAYRHFKSKDEFLTVLSNRTFEKFTGTLSKSQQSLGSLAKSANSKPTSNALENLGKAYFDFSRRKPNLFKLMFAGGFENISAEDVTLENRSQAYKIIRNTVSLYVNQQNLTGEEIEDEIDMYSFFCWCLIHGFCFIENDWFKDDPQNSEARLGVLIDLAMRTLLN